MPKFRLNVKVTQKGAVFNASATKANATRMVTRINEALAQEAVNRIGQRLGKVLQNPTGYYQSKIQVVKRQQYRGVSDGGVLYGGWLEGIDARNSTSRFKGYHTFRTVAQSMAQDKAKIAQPFVNKFVAEMNG
jgi:hypothetical protein